MATSFPDTRPTTTYGEIVNADRRYLIVRSIFRGAQITSCLAPPLYWMWQAMVGVRVTVPRLLRATGTTTFGIIPLGAILSYQHVYAQPSWVLRQNADRMRASQSHAQLDYLSGAGMLVGAVSTRFIPAARSVPLLPRTAGGAALGLAAGVVVHIVTGGPIAGLVELFS